MPGRLSPPAHTPLAALPIMVLDLETTGLDVSRERVIQIGAIPMLGADVQEGPRLDQLIDPGIPIPEAASRVHGLRAKDVAGAPAFADYIEILRKTLAGRVVVGHHIGFDLAVLRHEAARVGVQWQEPPCLDLAMVAGALDPSLPDLGLETITSRLGVSIQARHSAMGDCLATAEAFALVLTMLRDKDIRTLGEARALAAQRSDLARRQAQAGWHATPGEAIGAAPPTPALLLDGYTFERRLRDVMSSPAQFIARQESAQAAARRMVEQRIGSLLVGDPELPPEGIVTERDLLRIAARAAPLLEHSHVAHAMSVPVTSMGAEEMLYRALGRMDRLKIRHLAVTDPQGIAIGMVSQRDLLAYRARAVGSLGDALAEAGSAAELAAAFGHVPRIARGLVDEGLGGLDVARVVSSELQALTARSAEIVARRLVKHGHGPAPARWCVLVLGSGGRAESLLGADQDNALVHDGDDGDAPWFAALGEGIAELLHVAGVPRCKGGVMASVAQWRGNRAAWRDRIADWLSSADTENVLNVAIFFDLIAVAGDIELAHGLHRDALRSASRSLPFLDLMARSVQSLQPRLGFMGRLPSKQGRVDLKRDGLLPLVSLARTIALRLGSTARATPQRLSAAAASGRLADSDAAALTELHRDLLDVVLAQQLQDLADGVPPSMTVVMRGIEHRQRRRILASLKILDHVLRDLPGAISR